MKKLLFTLMAFAWCLSINAQNDSFDLGRVKKINGIEAYIMCEPLRDYETIVDIGTGFKAESVITGGLVNKSISGRIEQFIKRAKKENSNIDAVVYSSGKRIVGVKFKDKATEKTKGIARVSKIKGHFVFVMCEPLTSYDILTTKGGGIKWKSYVSGGLVNNSIDEDVEKIANKLDSVNGVDAFLFDGSKEGAAIAFK